MLVLVSHQNFQDCLLALYSNVLVLNHVSPHFQLLLTTIEIYTIPMSHYINYYIDPHEKNNVTTKNNSFDSPVAVPQVPHSALAASRFASAIWRRFFSSKASIWPVAANDTRWRYHT